MVNTIPILSSNEEQLLRISKDNLLSLSLEEMKAIKKYYEKEGRNPTDVEMETIAQTWSEHCKHKTLTGIIEYYEDGKKVVIDNLLKSTIMKATYELGLPWCVSVFKDNAGIIKFDEKNNIAFKVETHNHPSALEPYGGASTGIGGVIRDILGVGLGAKPILNTDVFCFGNPNFSFSKLPEGILHPKRIMKGVVSGVRDYGNRMGIPTANGAVIFDDGYLCNPLVYCGTIGIMPKDKCNKEVKGGDLILAIGGRTGRDGIHGATFSSLGLDKDTKVSAVQIGNPIMEKKFTDTLIQARDQGLYRAITDCGAGGFSSAIGELGKDCGARVFLERVPLKYAGLMPWEIWVSESQERMILAVPPKNLNRIMNVFSNEDVEATVLGEFSSDKKLVLFYKGKKVCDLDMNFLHNGIPHIKQKAIWKKPTQPKIHFKSNNILSDLKRILSHPTISSKEWIIRQYDHEVQGCSIIKPLMGVNNDGPSDGCVIKPCFDSYRGIAVANGINPQYGKIDPYWMAASSIDEALRNIVAIGGNPQKTFLLDNFCWGDPKKHQQLGGLVRAALACYDFAKGFKTPFISGKDSLNNEYKIKTKSGHKSVSIPATLLISAISIVEDVRNVVTLDLKRKDNLIYIVGETKDELGGSYFYLVNKKFGGEVPKVDSKISRSTMMSIYKAIQNGLIESIHDCSEGGIAVCITEMAFSGEMGVEVDIDKVPRKGRFNNPQNIIFSESNSRFIIEIKRENKNKFEKILSGLSFGKVGFVTDTKNLIIKYKEKTILKESILSLKEIWQKTLMSL